MAGRGTYTDDITLPRMVHAAFVQPPCACAHRAPGYGAAARAPGVVKVMTGAELAKMCVGPVGTLTCFLGQPAPQYPMAVDRKVSWHGEPVVMVVAETRALAEDACELVAIDWEELPVVAHKETALEPGTPARIPNSATTWRSARWSTPAAWTRSSRRPTWWSRARSASGGTPP